MDDIYKTEEEYKREYEGDWGKYFDEYIMICPVCHCSMILIKESLGTQLWQCPNCNQSRRKDWTQFP